MKKSTRFSSRSKKQSFLFGEERRTLLRNLEETKRELDLAYIGFNQCSDPDLIEFYLYEINALRAQHTYLLRRIKALDSNTSSAQPNAPAPTPNQPFQNS
ncbi:MAG: hypothetical protein K0S60_257 [Evtepia sp.]|jgi:hypothetical protein|nr:hypothetical protein [Evtepia sp.]